MFREENKKKTMLRSGAIGSMNKGICGVDGMKSYAVDKLWKISAVRSII